MLLQSPAPDKNNPSHSGQCHAAECIAGWSDRAAGTVVGVLAGEGIGPEVVGAALSVFEASMSVGAGRLHLRHGVAAMGGAGLSPDTVEFCESILTEGGALFCGPVGGRFVYELRARFDLYCKLVPLRPSAALADAAIVRAERLAGADVLLVRENVGGIYFGEAGRRERGGVAYQSFCYRAEQVERIAEVAARLARMRQGRLSAVVKRAGVPEISALWCEVVGEVASRYNLDLEIVEVDNAGYQMVADARRFDVVVAPNLFGDVLADCAAVLLGSRGMSYSANFGPQRRSAYQTGHGAAHDLAGSDRANPVAQILSLAMMLRESFALELEALRIETAVENVLAAGIRTPDIASCDSQVVGTRELAERVAREVERLSIADRVSP